LTRFKILKIIINGVIASRMKHSQLCEFGIGFFIVSKKLQAMQGKKSERAVHEFF